MQLEDADRMCWACDRHGLWGKARVLGVERHGGERCSARVSFSGFSKKYDEDIIVGDGRLRPLELGPHDAATQPSPHTRPVQDPHPPYDWLLQRQ